MLQNNTISLLLGPITLKWGTPCNLTMSLRFLCFCYFSANYHGSFDTLTILQESIDNVWDNFVESLEGTVKRKKEFR